MSKWVPASCYNKLVKGLVVNLPWKSQASHPGEVALSYLMPTRGGGGGVLAIMGYIGGLHPKGGAFFGRKLYILKVGWSIEKGRKLPLSCGI